MTHERTLFMRASWLLAALTLAATRSASAQIPAAGPLTISTVTVGSQPAPVTASVVYAPGLVFTGQRRVLVSINTNMPASTTLAVRITGGAGGTSLGYVNLTTVPVDAVIAAAQTFFVTTTISYTFTALVAAGVIPVSSRTVTFTVATWP